MAGGGQSLLIVDDDQLIVELLCEALAGDYDPVGAGSRSEVAGALCQLGGNPRSALIDLGLPPHCDTPEEGFAIVRDLVAACPDCAVVVVSGQDEKRHGQLARTLGAMDFVSKPCGPEQIREALARSRAALDASAGNDGIIGGSPAIARLRLQIRQYSGADYPVLIEGESGTGKELVARALHNSGRPGQPFVAVNCAALPAQLFEASLFGAKRGSYTGAAADSRGFFDEAAGGTLLLDEIGDLPGELQPKLLRALETGEYNRVGDPKPRTAAARILAATNRGLTESLDAGKFREDLYHRLGVLTIRAPALREMGADRFELLEHFCGRAAARGETESFTLDSDAQTLWERYRFPGNVRELRNIVARLQIANPGLVVDENTLAAELMDPGGGSGGSVAAERLRADLSGLDAMLRTDAQTYARAAVAEYGGEKPAARRLGVTVARLRELLDATDN